MAKISLTKLKLTSNLKPVELKWNEQTIEVKQYLPIQDKLEMITKVLNASIDDNKFYNPGKIELFFVLNVIEFYTNISLTEKQKEDPAKLYDNFVASGIYEQIFNTIPEDDIGFVYRTMYDSIKQIYDYQNSAYGILDSLKTDYDGLNFDFSKIAEKLQNKEDIELLNDIMNKLG